MLECTYKFTWHYKLEDQHCLEDILQDEHWKYEQDLPDRFHVVGV